MVKKRYRPEEIIIKLRQIQFEETQVLLEQQGQPWPAPIGTQKSYPSIKVHPWSRCRGWWRAEGQSMPWGSFRTWLYNTSISLSLIKISSRKLCFICLRYSLMKYRMISYSTIRWTFWEERASTSCGKGHDMNKQKEVQTQQLFSWMREGTAKRLGINAVHYIRPIVVTDYSNSDSLEPPISAGRSFICEIPSLT